MEPLWKPTLYLEPYPSDRHLLCMGNRLRNKQPNVIIPKCTNGRVLATVNPYTSVFIELPATTPCPTPEPIDPIEGPTLEP